MTRFDLTQYPRLAELLDALCDRGLSDAEADELAALVKTNAQARECYIQYLDLHAQLEWNSGLSPSDFSAAPAAEASTSDTRASSKDGGDDAADLPSAASAAEWRSTMQELLLEAELATAAELVPTISPEPRANAEHSGETEGRRQRWKTSAVVAALMVVAVAGIAFWSDRTEIAPNTIADNDTPQPSPPGPELPSTGVDTDKPGSLPPELPKLDWTHLKSDEPQVAEKDGVSPQATPIRRAPAAPDNMVAAINTHIRRGWEDMQVAPSPPASDYEWVRRVYLDLTGRIPTASEIETFVADESADRKQQLVRRLIDSELFALQWSARWTNLLVGRSPGEQVDRISLQRYLRKTLLSGNGWDTVVADLVSAEGNPHENGEANFLLAHLNNQAVPATAFVARTLLGTQIHCAQCHKHPFYDVTQQEFWELNSFFKQAVVSRDGKPVDEMMGPGEYELSDKAVGGPTYYETRNGLMQVAYPKFSGREVSAASDIARRQELASILTSGDDPLIAKAFVNRTWSHLFGYGFTSPVDDMGPHNPPTHPALLDDLSRAFVASGYDVKQLIEWICLSEPYRLSSQMTAGNERDDPERGELPAFSRMYFKPLTAEQLYDSLLTLQGKPDQADRSWEKHVRNREDWVLQFVSSLENDENDEASHFDGTITQALAMMNGSLVERTVSPQQNTALDRLVQASLSDVEKFERVCLSVLSRQPTPSEIALFRKLTRPLRDIRNPREREMLLASRLEDAVWAYLNSSEFIINH